MIKLTRTIRQNKFSDSASLEREMEIRDNVTERELWYACLLLCFEEEILTDLDENSFIKFFSKEQNEKLQEKTLKYMEQYVKGQTDEQSPE